MQIIPMLSTLNQQHPKTQKENIFCISIRSTKSFNDTLKQCISEQKLKAILAITFFQLPSSPLHYFLQPYVIHVFSGYLSPFTL